MHPRVVPLILCMLLLGAAPAHAQVPGPRRSVTAVRVEQPPVLDGVLDDAAWGQATFTTDFLQKEPDQGLPATLRTEVAFVYDGDALYVGARMFSDSPADIETVMTRRDESGVAERLILSFDTWNDRRTAYSFAVTAAGQRVDWFHPVDSEYERDFSFNPVWEARTRLTGEGWVAELRIPFSQLRFNDGDEQVWGLNLNRYIPRRNEDDFWVVVPRHVTGWSSWFGELTGVRGVRPSRRLELLPYVAGDWQVNAGQNPRAGTPYDARRDWAGRVGGDAKVGLGPNLTLDATVNPDFGQLEADPAVVNLTAFETFFEERRPFFTEGSQLFTGNGPTYFYSRRVGASPRLLADLQAQRDYVEAPRASTLWGAGKLTGRLASGLSVGALAAVTGHSYADVYDFDTAAEGRVKLEPFTGYGVVRVQQELGEGSVVGAMVTGVHRALTPQGLGESLAFNLPQQAYTAGADASFRLGAGGEYVLTAYAGGSYVSGTREAMVRLQRSSARYYQRPDQTYARLNPEATSLSGYTAGAVLERVSGRNWLWRVRGFAESPGFEINDVGRLQSADDLDAELSLTYRDTDPGRWLRGLEATLALYNDWNYGGVRQSTSVSSTVSVTFPNFWTAEVTTTYLPRALSDGLTRGGPLMQTGQGVDLIAEVSNAFSATTRWSLETKTWRYETGSHGFTLEGKLGVQPTRRLRLSVEPGVSRYTEEPQYVATVSGGRAETYGQRYVFGAVERQELFARLRADFFVTPDLSVELYAEPFASSGSYSRFGELFQPRGRALLRYDEASVTRADGKLRLVAPSGEAFEVDDPDFNLRSLRSNLVVRWEFRPGSTLFVVWQQDRSNNRALGRVLEPDALGNSFSAPGSHTFALKLAWWLPVK
ncbi:carbohydrate binding family 9 domain-containing protein [Pyxidicoccus parkwayensis]|uniref:Carbohydrate binding family 9 domain-containing protein n=1 Tax=Pyxidicoccus parkwayensis TaxID=2813578 RepID=A0ABX7NWT5_9BACT|nr:DUF5916 domain-containing protein [Pyxidicoccus parkwaysis]QSQ22839.1 carbohydrate binding family 9 domain-containing protein [Pyxidicoccus parkwaysis]